MEFDILMLFVFSFISVSTFFFFFWFYMAIEGEVRRKELDYIALLWFYRGHLLAKGWLLLSIIQNTTA